MMMLVVVMMMEYTVTSLVTLS